MSHKEDLYQVATRYLQRGWPIFPVGGPDGKRPLVAWGQVAVVTDAQIREWLQSLPMTGWGLPTGSRSGLVVVDVDGGEAPAWAVPTYTVTTPRGWHLYYATSEPIKNSVKALADNVDVRGDGGFVVLPGSRRPDGREYIEEGGEVAPLPAQVLEACRKPPPELIVLREPLPGASEAFGRAQAYAERCEPAISGSGGHAQALRVARAMVDGFGLSEGEAMAALGPWNARCQPPWNERELAHKVRQAATTADPAGRERGYLLHEGRGRDEIMLVDDLDDMPEIAHAPNPVAVDEDAIREQLAREIENIGDIGRMYMQWLRESSRIWQPGLAVGSALALGATLAGRRYVWRGTTSHLYVLGVGGSGTGKDIAAKRLGSILGDQTMGGIPSTKALRDRLAEVSQRGRGLCLISGEVAKLLRQLLGPRVPAYLQLGGQMLLELATWGVEPMRLDRAASDHGGGDAQMVIDAPSLSIYGTATPEDLLDILGEGSVKDGMLGRFIICRAQDKLPDKDVFLEPRGMPQALAKVMADRAREIDNWISRAENDIYAPPPEPLPGSRGRVLAAYDAEIHRARQLAPKGGPKGMPDELVARLAEHATRVSIALAGLSSSPFVSEACERLAIAIVEQSARDLAETTRRHAARDSWERGLKRVLAACERLAGADGVVRACDLAAAVRARELGEWIDALCAEGALVKQEAKTKAGRVAVRYRLPR